MFVLIQTFFFIAARFGKTTSSLPLPSGKPIGITKPSTINEFRQANWYMLPPGLTCECCFGSVHTKQTSVLNGKHICVPCDTQEFHRTKSAKVRTEFYYKLFCMGNSISETEVVGHHSVLRTIFPLGKVVLI